jgi:methylase of polypeptide subunit release factors
MDASIGGQPTQTAVNEFLARTGAWLPVPAAKFFEQSATAFGNEYTTRLEQLTTVDKADADHQQMIRDQLFRDLETARAGWLRESPALHLFLEHLATMDLPEGNAIDLGCGSGLLACYLATVRPNYRVVGIDLSDR